MKAGWEASWHIRRPNREVVEKGQVAGFSMLLVSCDKK